MAEEKWENIGSGKYKCSVCGYVYDPSQHDNIPLEELPEDWKCPRCKKPKEKFIIIV